jgi:hypothetical protein
MKKVWGCPLGLALLLLPILALFAGANGCETLGVSDNKDDDHYSRGHDDHDYDRNRDRDHDRDYDRGRERGEWREYDYYPRREVYYNRETQIYTYWDNHQLERRRKLPDYVRDSMGHERVSVRLRGDEPERFHERIKREYPSRGDGDHRDRDWSRGEQREGRGEIPRDAHVYGDRGRAEAYDYYPRRGVFYNLENHEYTFEDHGQWQRDRDPPDYIKREMGSDRERIYIDGERPEKFHDLVRRDFPR